MPRKAAQAMSAKRIAPWILITAVMAAATGAYFFFGAGDFANQALVKATREGLPAATVDSYRLDRMTEFQTTGRYLFVTAAVLGWVAFVVFWSSRRRAANTEA